MAFQPLKTITSIINGLTKRSSVLKGINVPNFAKVVASKKVSSITILQTQIIQTHIIVIAVSFMSILLTQKIRNTTFYLIL